MPRNLIDASNRWTVRRGCERLSRIEGVKWLDFDVMNWRLRIHHGLARPAPVLSALADVGRPGRAPASQACGVPRDAAESARACAIFQIVEVAAPTERDSICPMRGAACTGDTIEATHLAWMRGIRQKLPESTALSRRTAGVLRQSISFAVGNPAADAGLASLVVVGATLWMARPADRGASPLVVGNRLRLLCGDLAAAR